MAVSKYYLTCSVAYLASSIVELPIQKEPWLHARLISLTKVNEDTRKRETAWYVVVYIWDTREVVQWYEIPRGQIRQQGMKDVKAIDNEQPLKDTKHLVPDWAKKLIRNFKNYDFEVTT
jgi:hypothetical protein